MQSSKFHPREFRRTVTESIHESFEDLGNIPLDILHAWRSLYLVVDAIAIKISVLEIMNSGSIEELGKLASEGLRRKYEVEVRADGDTSANESTLAERSKVQPLREMKDERAS